MQKIKVYITNKQNEVKVPKGIRMLIRRCCHAVLLMEDFRDSAEISVVFVNNKQMQELNKVHRGIDKVTDVLSFPMINEDEKAETKLEDSCALGDIVISLEQAAEQAKIYQHSLQREIAYLTAHSVLHLLGYVHEDSQTDQLSMREKEERIMSQLGLSITSAFYS